MAGRVARDPRRQPLLARAARRLSRLPRDRKSTRLNFSHSQTTYAVFCFKKKKSTVAIDSLIDPNTVTIAAVLFYPDGCVRAADRLTFSKQACTSLDSLSSRLLRNTAQHD